MNFCAEREPITHDVKCSPTYFRQVQGGNKTFELRLNDRDYREGDTIILREFDRGANGCKGDYTGDSVIRKIGYVLQGYPGLQQNYCIMSLIEVENDKPE